MCFSLLYRRSDFIESQLRFQSIKRQLIRLRDRKYPPRPTTNEEMESLFRESDIIENYGKTLNKKHRLYIGSVVEEDFAFHVFASLATIDIVEKFIPTEKRKYLIDGTFSVVPRIFKQFLIIAIEYKNHVSLFSIFGYHKNLSNGCHNRVVHGYSIIPM